MNLLNQLSTVYRKFRTIFFALTLIICAISAQAHDPGLSTLTLRVEAKQVEAVVVLSAVDARGVVDLEKARNNQITSVRPILLRLNGIDVEPLTVRASADELNNVQVRLIFPSGSLTNVSGKSLWLPLLPVGHREYFSIQNERGVTLAERLLSANSNTFSLEVSADEPNQGDEKRASFLGFLTMGIRHIWTGYDHLLFLFGLLAVTRNTKTVLKIITCFTLAHSLTLAVATLDLLQLPGRIVEPLIAVSIVFVGVENFLRREEPAGRAWLTFAFGLVHGFGFASALREVGVRGDAGGVLVPLASFNFGVELGQVALAVIALPLIWKLKTQRGVASHWIPITSGLVALMGAYWFVERVWF